VGSFDPLPKRTPYLAVPEWLFRVPGLKREAVLTYAVLHSFWRFQHRCNPSLGTVAKRLGIGRRQVIRHVQHLEELGLIRALRKQGTDGRLHGSNLDRVTEYEFRHHPAFGGDAQDTTGGDTEDTTGGDAQDTTVVSSKARGGVLQGTGGGVLDVTQVRRESKKRVREDARKRASTSRPATALEDPRVQEIADHYRLKLQPAASWKLETKVGVKTRAVTVLDALDRGHTVDELKRAIDGLAASEWHRDKGQTDLELVMREGKTEAFIKRAKAKPHGMASPSPESAFDAVGSQARAFALLDGGTQ